MNVPSTSPLILVTLLCVTGCASTPPAPTASAANEPPKAAKPEQDPDLFSSPTAGFSIVRAPGWQFASIQQIVDNRSRAELSDKDLQERMRKHATAPLVAITKYSEPYDDLNPAVQVTLRPMGQLEGEAPTRILAAVMAQLGQSLADFELEKAPQAVEVAGKDAAFVQSRYTVGTADGRTFAVRSRMWIVPRGAYMFMIGMSGPQTGENVSDEEFQRMLASIRIED